MCTRVFSVCVHRGLKRLSVYKGVFCVQSVCLRTQMTLVSLYAHVALHCLCTQRSIMIVCVQRGLQCLSVCTGVFSVCVHRGLQCLPAHTGVLSVCHRGHNWLSVYAESVSVCVRILCLYTQGPSLTFCRCDQSVCINTDKKTTDKWGLMYRMWKCLFKGCEYSCGSDRKANIWYLLGTPKNLSLISHNHA